MDLNFQRFSAQGESVSALAAQIQTRTLAHAVLITGEEGVGKKTLADLMASALLCRGEGPRPCGKCPACIQAAAGEHPDLIRIRLGTPLSGEGGKTRATIPVDDIREMEKIAGVHPFEGDNRVILIQDADKMTPAAQNALLKILEEPPEGNWFILICTQREALLPTIISRCRPVFLHPWPDEIVMQSLSERNITGKRAEETVAEAGGSIGLALKLGEDEEYWKTRDEIYQSFFGCPSRSDIIRISEKWKENRALSETILSVLESAVSRLLHFRLTGSAEKMAARLKGTFPEAWIHWASSCDLSSFTDLLDAFSLSRRQLQASVSPQAVLEKVLFSLMEAKDKWSA